MRKMVLARQRALSLLAVTSLVVLAGLVGSGVERGPVSTVQGT
jgi:hypothetical protein